MATSWVPGRSTTDALLRLGRWIPLVFLSTTVICGFMLGNYNHLSRMVSELGAIGTPSQFYFSAGLILCATMSALFVVGLSRACSTLGISRLPALMLLAYTASIAGAGIFPRGLPGLKQRFFHLGWCVWFIYLSYGFARATRCSGAETCAARAS